MRVLVDIPNSAGPEFDRLRALVADTDMTMQVHEVPAPRLQAARRMILAYEDRIGRLKSALKDDMPAELAIKADVHLSRIMDQDREILRSGLKPVPCAHYWETIEYGGVPIAMVCTDCGARRKVVDP